jgi:metal-dependent amidase/aminoacylase/carboxypeptidase family protein
MTGIRSLAAGRHQKEDIMAEHTTRNSASVVLANLGKLLPDLETLYKDIHAHPELSMQETRTAGIAADRLRKAGLQAGTKENVIPDEAIIKLNVRTFDAGVRKHVLAAIERIVNAEAEASGAPRKPEITPLDRYPLNVNDVTASNRIAEAFRGYFSAERVKHTGPAPASEDFGCFGTAWQVPSVFWFVGGNDPKVYAEAKSAGKLNELPVNHSPKFAPVLHPTLETGVEALVVGALAWLGAS